MVHEAFASVEGASFWGGGGGLLGHATQKIFNSESFKTTFPRLSGR